MEGLRTPEQVAAISLDAYLEALSSPHTVEGQLMNDEIQVFYFWLSKYYPEQGVIDGVSLETLYTKNVIDGDMDTAVFLQYCEQHQFPLPPKYQERNDPTSYLNIRFNKYRSEQQSLVDISYEAWAEDHGIATTPGSIMRFLDSEGYEYRVRTDTDNRGQIIA